MSRPAKGPRLYPQAERRDPDTGVVVEHAVWVIRDGSRKRSTGIRVEDRRRPPQEAEDALTDYRVAKRETPRERNRAADAIAIADVIAVYLKDKSAEQARPREVAGRAKQLLAFWGKKRLSEVTGRTCRDYVEFRSGAAVARRELEDLRAAIRYHREEGLCREEIIVTLPEKGEARTRWLTRTEAARLLWSAWRYREVQKGHATGRRSRRHVARFILVALYTGTRAGAVCQAALVPTPGAGWINLENGVFYRRPEDQRETKKRKPPVRLPERLLAHLRRWHAKGKCRQYAVEWYGEPVGDVDKAFRNTVKDAGLSPDVTPHSLRHTAATWLMLNGVELWEAAGFLGMTVETLERVYGHHHPDFQTGAAAGITSKRKDAAKPARAGNVVPIAEKGAA
jgi:integrase